MRTADEMSLQASPGRLAGADDDQDVLPIQFKSSGCCLDDVKGGELYIEMVCEDGREETEDFGARRFKVGVPRVV